MKTPRQILLERHRSAEPALNRIRMEVLSASAKQQRSSADKPANRFPRIWPLGWLMELWRELIWPVRRIWAGFAVVWLAIVVVNWSVMDHRPQAEAEAHVPAAEMMAIWKQQQKLTAELIGLGEDRDRQADKPKPVLNRPRSERRPPWEVA